MSIQKKVNKQIRSFRLNLEEAEKQFHKKNEIDYEKNIANASDALKKIIELGAINLALELEISWYKLVKLKETERNYYLAFRNHANSFFKAGQNRAQLTRKFTDNKKIVFILHNSHILAHTELMLIIIRQWRTHWPEQKIFVAWIYEGGKDDLQRILKELEVQIITVNHILSMQDKIEGLRDIFNNYEIDRAIWVSVPVTASYLFGLNIAPKQYFWAIKFHPWHLGDNIKYIANVKKDASENHTIILNKKLWKTYLLPLDIKINKNSSELIKKIKNNFENKFLFGTLARTEKFNSENFCECIVKIIKQCPSSLFLYTGHEKSQYLELIAKRSNLNNQIIYIGWVDTNLYSEVIDIFLETFPFGCAITGIQALKQGTKLISLWEDDTLPRWYFKDKSEAIKYKEFWSVALNEEEYIKKSVDSYKSNTKNNNKKTMKAEIELIAQNNAKNFYKLIN